jgi:hypothetical protein
LGVRARHVASWRLEPLRTSLGISPARITDATPQASPIRRSGALGHADTLLSVCYTTVMASSTRYKVRRVVSRGTPSYQLGHYEMTGRPGARRSVFKVLVHLGEHATPEAALEAWREDVERAQRVGREKTAARIEAKIRKLEGAISDRTEAR